MGEGTGEGGREGTGEGGREGPEGCCFIRVIFLLIAPSPIFLYHSCSGLFDKLTLSSTPASPKTSRYAVAAVHEGKDNPIAATY